MATATLLSGPTTDTGNTPNSSASFAPSVNDLLVVVVTKEASVLSSPIVSADLTSSVAPTAFTLVRTQGFGTSAHQLAVFVANGLCTDTTSRTVTIASGADAGGGTILAVYRVSGMTRTGASAIRQSGGETDQASGEIPSVNFDTGVALTGNAIIGAVGAVDNTPALTAPASFTEDGDTGYTTGAVQGLEIVHRDSGHTSQTVAWQTATIGGSYATIILELDTSGVPIEKTLGQVAETDTVVALDFDKPIHKTLGQVAETDTVQTITFSQPPPGVTLTPVAETDTVQALNVDKAKTLTPVLETDTVQPLSFVKPIVKVLAAINETDLVVPLSIAGQEVEASWQEINAEKRLIQPDLETIP